jgi:SAM-dependent methyltransferase
VIDSGQTTTRSSNAWRGPRDPVSLTLSDLDLPRAWPDDIFRQLGAFLRFFRTLLFGGRNVVLPAGLPRAAVLPDYLLREFHRMPNGYYSYMLVDGYERGFERAMLGQVELVRTWIAQQLRDCQSVLEIGCGSGKLSGAVAAGGVPEVWGIDASPYQLMLALRRFPGIKFVHGVAERTPFADGRFDGVAVCFVFHELPTEAQDAVLAEMHRLLRPGGRIVRVAVAAARLARSLLPPARDVRDRAIRGAMARSRHRRVGRAAPVRSREARLRGAVQSHRAAPAVTWRW